MLDSGSEECGRFVPRFVCEGERSPVDAQEMLSADVAGDLEGFSGIGVLCVHEPAGRVSTDRENGNERSAAAIANLREYLAVLICSVSGTVDAARRSGRNSCSPSCNKSLR